MRISSRGPAAVAVIRSTLVVIRSPRLTAAMPPAIIGPRIIPSRMPISSSVPMSGGNTPMFRKPRAMRVKSWSNIVVK